MLRPQLRKRSALRAGGILQRPTTRCLQQRQQHVLMSRCLQVRQRAASTVRSSLDCTTSELHGALAPELQLCYYTGSPVCGCAGLPQGTERSCPPPAGQTAAYRIAVCRTLLAQDRQGDCAAAHDAHGPLSLLLAAEHARYVRLAVQEAGSTVSRTALLLPAHQPRQCWPRSREPPP
jgi:hypothetical protein